MSLHAPQCSCGKDFKDADALGDHLETHQINPHDRHSVRKPTEDEIDALVAYFRDQGMSADEIFHTVNAQYMVVIEGYITGGPGYAGRLLLTVAEATPNYYQAFRWCHENDGGGWTPLEQADALQEMYERLRGGDA